MTHPASRRSRKAGLPPGSLVHIGKRQRESPRITVARYNAETFSEQVVTDVALACQRQSGTVTWVNVDGLHDTKILDALGHGFGLHPLVIEDILNTDQRPKVEDHGDYLYIVLRLLSWDTSAPGVSFEQLSLVLGADFVLSFQEGAHDDLVTVRQRLANNAARVRSQSADYLAYVLLDTIVDNYFLVLEKFDDQAELLETELVTDPKQPTLIALHRVRRDVVFLLRAIRPLREVVGRLERAEVSLFQPATRPYLRDVYDHVLHAIDTVETQRELAAGMLEIYLTSVTNRSNEVIRVLTLIATIFLPITFITSWYGMNFRHMPELDWPWSYPVLIVITLGSIGGMAVFFKRRKWL